MARQGCAFSEQEIQNAVRLLRTDMTVGQIAARMSCSRSAVLAINRKFNVRSYAGRRSTWEQTEMMTDSLAPALS